MKMCKKKKTYYKELKSIILHSENLQEILLYMRFYKNNILMNISEFKKEHLRITRLLDKVNTDNNKQKRINRIKEQVET